MVSSRNISQLVSGGSVTDSLALVDKPSIGLPNVVLPGWLHTCYQERNFSDILTENFDDFLLP